MMATRYDETLSGPAQCVVSAYDTLKRRRSIDFDRDVSAACIPSALGHSSRWVTTM